MNTAKLFLDWIGQSRFLWNDSIKTSSNSGRRARECAVASESKLGRERMSVNLQCSEGTFIN